MDKNGLFTSAGILLVLVFALFLAANFQKAATASYAFQSSGLVARSAGVQGCGYIDQVCCANSRCNSPQLHCSTNNRCLTNGQ